MFHIHDPCLNRGVSSCQTHNLLIISMSASYSFVLAGKYSVGKSSIFQRLKTGTAPDGIVEGMSGCTWGSAAHDDEGLDSFVYQTQLAGKKIKVDTLHACLH